MSETVYITAQGDKYHARSNCSGITDAQKSGLTQGYELHEPEAVTLAEAQERGKGRPCMTCIGRGGVSGPAHVKGEPCRSRTN
jgi:hypothetical protein